MANLTYFKKFGTKSDYDAYIGGDPVLPNVSIVANEDVYFKDGESPVPPHDYSQDYLTFKITGDGNIVWRTNNTAYTTTISYSKDSGETWTDITSNTGNSAPSISVVSGDTVLFKGNNKTYCRTATVIMYNRFSSISCQFEVEGNVMSLLYADNFQNQTTLPQESGYTFSGLFNDCTGLTMAENLVLPATALTFTCYGFMFSGCTSLTTAPSILPATTLVNDCYEYMFAGCTSLTSAPELPATTLASYCYNKMFVDCTSLTTAPGIPATTLAVGCCRGMFSYCTSLTTAPSILPATTLVNNCYEYMFAGCTSLTSAPELPATTLAESCYEYMFLGCRSLNYIKCLATDISANNCTANWLHMYQDPGSGSGSGSGDGSAGVTNGTFVKNPNITESTWGRGESGIPDGWTVEDAF